MSPFTDTKRNPVLDIDEGLRTLVKQHADGFCGEMLQEHLDTGGKRLRAKLTLQLADLFYIAPKDAMQWALAVELLHNATLIHDDVQDGDRTRRNRPTTWAVHGVAQAINAGDLGLMLPYQCIENMSISDDVRWRLAQTLSKHSIATVNGQSLEMRLLSNRDFTLESYTTASLGKTGAFFGLPMEGIAHLANLDKTECQQLVDLFSQIGLLFQMQDDILDCFGNKGRQQGADICEGKVSFLVVNHLCLYPEDKPMFTDILERPSPVDHDTIEHCIDTFAEHGALSLALQELSSLEHRICSATILSSYPTLQQLVYKLLDTIMNPIQHLFETPLEMTQ